MRCFISIIAVAIVFLEPARAQDRVGMLSAEGSGRLVLDAWPANGWSVKTFENLVEVRFPQSRFDLVAEAGLVDSLGPNVTAVDLEARDGDNYLRLTLDCDCPVSLTGNGTDRLELVIIPTGAAQRARAASGPAPTRAPRPPAKPGQGSGTTVAVGEDGKLDVDEARARLLEQLMKAAEAGIVDMRPEHAEAKPQVVPPKPDTMSTEPVEPMAAKKEKAPAVADEHLAADAPDAGDQTPISMKQEEVADPSEVLPASSEPMAELVAYDPDPMCFDDGMFEFPELEGPTGFVDALSEQRGRLVGEFDMPVKAVAMELARTYLAAGMAAEARAVATDFVPDTPESVLLQEIAAVLDGKSLSARASLLKTDCEGDQALWRAVALARMDGNAQAVLDAELVSGRSLERMPLDLREFAAASIGNAAVARGEWDTARRMEAMAIRAVAGRKTPHGETLLLAARMADWNDKPDLAWEMRQKARRSGPPYSDTALIEIAETILRSEDYLGAKTGTLQIELGDLARRERGTDLGAKAFELEARLHAREHNRDQVVDLLAEGARTGVLPEEQQAPLLSELIDDSKLGELSRPVGLIYLENPTRFGEAMKQTGFRRAVARSLTEMGLPGLAEPVLIANDYTDTNLVAGLSEAFLATGDARRALDVAQQMQKGSDRDGAMAAALAALGETTRSLPLMSALTANEDDPMQAQHAALERAVDAGVATGDLSAAQTAAAKLLDLDPSQKRAEGLVMLALMAEATSMPAAAKTVLDEVSPGRSAELEVLFKPTMSDGGLKDHAEATDLLERMETEVELLEGLLNNG